MPTRRKVAATLSSRPPLDPEVLKGLPGDVVRSCAGETEADPAAVLAAYRNETGNLIGYGPYLRIARYRYPPLFHDVISGPQDEGRKSTGVEEVEEITRLVDPGWFAAVEPGLESHVALVEAAAEAPGHRLLLRMDEFATMLDLMLRQGRVGPLMREAFGKTSLSTRRSGRALRVEGAHLSVLGSITDEEFRSKIRQEDLTNGQFSRWTCYWSERNGRVPFPPPRVKGELQKLADRTADVIEFAQDLAFQRAGIGPVERLLYRHTGLVPPGGLLAGATHTDAFEKFWRDGYGEGHNPGKFPNLPRAATHIGRNTFWFQMMDFAAEADEIHGYRGWKLYENSVAATGQIFGSPTRNEYADRWVRAARQGKLKPWHTRTDIHHVLGNNLSKDEIDACIEAGLKSSYMVAREGQGRIKQEFDLQRGGLG